MWYRQHTVFLWSTNLPRSPLSLILLSKKKKKKVFCEKSSLFNSQLNSCRSALPKTIMPLWHATQVILRLVSLPWLLLRCRQLQSPVFLHHWGFPNGSDSKESTCNIGDQGSILGSGKIPWRREQLPTPVFLPREFHRQRGLMGYHPRSDRVGHNQATNTFNSLKRQMID